MIKLIMKLAMLVAVALCSTGAIASDDYHYEKVRAMCVEQANKAPQQDRIVVYMACMESNGAY